MKYLSRTIIRLFMAVAVVSFLAACGGGGSGGGGGGGGDTGGDSAGAGAQAGYNLDNITFSTQTAPALSTVTITGVPEVVYGMELFAEYSMGVTATVGEGGAIGYTLIEKVDPAVSGDKPPRRCTSRRSSTVRPSPSR